MADSTRHLTLDEVVERIKARSIPEPNSGCLLWDSVAEVNSRGDTRPQYARVRLRGKMVLIHRVMYEAAHGPVPPGLGVLHRCDVSLCCEPTHLFLGTNNDNHLDKALKDRGKKKLTIEKAREIHVMVASGATHIKTAEAFGVRQSTVSRIISGKRRPTAMIGI